MEDIFNDPEFRQSLCGRVPDLDQDIGMLVYKLFKIPFVETTWSCSGHIGRHLSPDVDAATRPGYFVHRQGFLLFELTEITLASEEFLQKTRDIVRQYSGFAELRKDSKYNIFLSMDDLVDPVKPEENCDDASLEKFHVTDYGWNKQFNRVHARKSEVREDLAVQRYEEFKKFWKDMEIIADLYKK